MDIYANKAAYLLVMALSALPMSMSVMAHDPSEHMAAAEEPDCSAMEGAGDMDMSDPVAQAVMKQCMAGMASEKNHTGMNDGHEGNGTGGEDHKHGQAEAH